MKATTITVVGIGYVGLPLACLAASKGYKVYGFDINERLIQMVNKRKAPFKDSLVTKLLPKLTKKHGRFFLATNDPTPIRESEIVIVCVPTPVDKRHNPDFKPLIKATETIKANMRAGQLIIIESTINPGVCEEIVLPILQEGGLKEGRDFYLAHAPERVNPGDPHWDVSNLARNVGALSPKGLKKSVQFYESIVSAPINAMKSIKEAEATKTIENAFRDINIAFANEIAKSFDQLGIDVIDVIKGASSKFSFMPHWPGCGVGGHCIPVDPYYLIQKAESVGFSHDFLKLARTINNGMPQYTVDLLKNKLNEVGLPLKSTPVGVLGLSYKADIDDTRESPSFKIIEILKKSAATVMTFDPYIPDQSSEKTLEAILDKSAAIVIATNHKEFTRLKGKTLAAKGIKVVIDGKNCLDKKDIEKHNIIYKGIGR